MREPMLTIKIPKGEFWDEDRERFVRTSEATLVLEHSLSSIALWEARWHRPFFKDDDLTEEQSIDYIRCMTLNDVDDLVYEALPSSVFKTIADYMGDTMTGTTFSERGSNRPVRETISAEIIYQMMAANGIPFECDKWHFNRLTALIRVCLIKSSAPKKLGKAELRERNAALNAARRARLGTTG